MRREQSERSRSVLAKAALSFFALVGCTGPSPQPRIVDVGPLEAFASGVEPMLEERCAQGGCHGRPDRPFTLYAPGAYRRDPAQTSLALPLDADEVATNALRVAALADASDADASIALRKPLAVDAGGAHHGGGDVFVDRTDAGYRVLRDWLLSCRPPGEGGV